MGKSADSAQMQSLLKGTKAAMIVADEPVAIRLKYIGSGTVTSVTNDISTDLVLITSDGGTDTYLYSTYATVGQLADAIDGDGIFRAEVMDALRSDATDDMFVNGAYSLTGDGYFDVVVDTSAQFEITYRCKYDRNVGDEVPSGQHRVSLSQIKYFANVGTAAVNSVQVWEYDRANNVETQVYQALSIDNTDTTITFVSGRGAISSDFNNDLIVRVLDAGSLNNTSLYLSVLYDRE